VSDEPRVVVVEVAVAAPAAEVWRALTDDDRRHAWWPDLELEARVGGRLVERWRNGAGRAVTTSGAVLSVEPPERLRCSWRDDDWPEATEVELVVRDERGGAVVRLEHAGWERLGDAAATLADAHADGWRMHLADLKAYAESAAEPALRTAHAVREAVWARCAEQRGATLEHPFGPEAAVFKVAGKMFAVIPIPALPARVTLKCEPHFGAALVEEHAAITPGYHTDKRHWITVALDGSVEQDLLDDLVDGSYDLVVAKLPKRTQAALRGG